VLNVRGGDRVADPCQQGDRIVDELWTSGARDRVQTALARGGTAWTETTAAVVIDRLDAYLSRWATSHRDACEDYHRGGQSSEAFDLRGACLDERLREVQALVDVLGDADAEVQRNAIDAVDRIRPLAECDDLQALRTRVALPDDPTLRARVEELEQARAQVEAQLRAGLYDAGLARADELVAMARDVGHAPSIARALRDRALLHRRQTRVAEAAADCVVALVSAVAAEQRIEEAELRADDAAAIIARVARHDPRRAEDLAANLDEARGEVELRQHRYPEAAALYERSLASVERRMGSDSLRTAQALNALASARLPQGRGEDALALFRRVLAIRSTVLGVAHPETAMMHNNIGLTLKNLGRLDAAAAELEQARAQVGAALGPSHPSVRIAELNLAGVYYLQRRDVEAADLYAIALGKPAAMAAANRYDLHHVLHWGVSAARCGRIDEARELLEISRARAVALELEGVDANLADLEAEIHRAASTTISAAQ
jgi:hypothetical protein